MSDKARRVAERLHLEGRAWTRGELCTLAEVSIRQLQWWEMKRLAEPTITTSAISFYDERAAFRVMLVAAIRGKGISLQKMQRILAAVPDEPKGHIVLITDHIELFGSDEAAVFALTESASGGLVIDLAELVERLFGVEPKPRKTPVRRRRPAPPPGDYELTARELDRMYKNSLLVSDDE